MMDGGVLLLDGGLGHLLKAGGLAVDSLPYGQQFLAGALANVAQPELVIEGHTRYLRAGCAVLTTNTFACTRHSLAKIQRSNHLADLIQGAVACASLARQQCGRPVLIAGGVPPLKESYQSKGLGSDAELQGAYRELVELLTPGVDVLLCETLASVQEVRCACSAAAVAGTPVWVSVTLDDSLEACLRSGEGLQEAVHAALEACPALQAFLLNCCAPAAVTAALPTLRSCLPPGVRYGAYANGFKVTTTQWLSGSKASSVPIHAGDYDDQGMITPAAYCSAAAQWVDGGATIIGGCCGVGPRHMEALHELLTGTRTLPSRPPNQQS